MSNDIPHLEGWLAFPDAARRLGLRKQGFHYIALSTMRSPFRKSDIRRVGAEVRPMFIVRTAAVERERERRIAAGVLVVDANGDPVPQRGLQATHGE